MIKDIDNFDDKIEETIDTIIEYILEKNYREIDSISSDVRYACYADSDRFYSYIDNRYHTIPVKAYKFKLNDCSCNYLEKEIKKIIDPYVECLKIKNSLPPTHMRSFVLQPIDYNPDEEKILCIYYRNSKIKDDSIELYFGIGTC